MTDIVICVDGTNSGSYVNSSVKNFYRDVQGIKIYEPGPTAHGGISGADCVQIIEKVKERVDAFAPYFGEESFFNGLQCTKAAPKRVRFIMVGHSRGGHIVIQLAALLKYRTHFMGLYDAVARTINGDDDHTLRIQNVDHVFHAIRDASIGSRNGPDPSFFKVFLRGPFWPLLTGIDAALNFGNTGKSTGDGGFYQEVSFKTSHGGVGGDVVQKKWFATPVDDDSCTVTMFKRGRQQEAKSRLCVLESQEADRYIRNAARSLGVQI